ncbi:PLP-dependent aminotransferase family protein [Alkalimarinus sediminis]|uniref:PLP-dependent aminotransferase family protein n=1 Tax=Alkalimarinus sediminis TaxID=1632866 RepID=A0A9E8KPJ0_9ALTE|nr:PLP-dependent aminotransferase family protein [Alkalimarinus sediminis]UZW73552.1 PLP-dependent aminotransferase family protein [Alkalimarinus sediminis]
MDTPFSDRIADVPQSFIREILKVAMDPTVISFAGGLPNRDLFPIEGIKQATNKVLDEHGADALQYSNTEGYPELRQYISDRYRDKQGIDVPIKNILITNGSQQGLDLLGKTLLNEGDDVVIEEPGYLGAIQAFSVYRARFNPVPVSEEGLNIERLKGVMLSRKPKILYTVPNFQNPSGISYSEQNRLDVAEVLEGTSTFLVQDDPYGDLRFAGTEKASFKKLIPDNTVVLGSFSKTVVPSFRLGWIVAPDALMEKLVIAKQAADLHTNYFSQRIIHQFLADNDIDAHIKEITDVYGRQRAAMMNAIDEHFPKEVAITHPEGGMFLWGALPEGYSSMDLFDLAIKEKVAFVPGQPFYVSRQEVNTFRLNFSSVDEETIETGMARLGKVIKTLLSA